MFTKICFLHKRVNEDGNWRKEPDINGFMLYLRKPSLIAKCDICLQEDNLRETINLLRRQDESVTDLLYL